MRSELFINNTANRNSEQEATVFDFRDFVQNDVMRFNDFAGQLGMAMGLSPSTGPGLSYTQLDDWSYGTDLFKPHFRIVFSHAACLKTLTYNSPWHDSFYDECLEMIKRLAEQADNDGVDYKIYWND